MMGRLLRHCILFILLSACYDRSDGLQYLLPYYFTCPGIEESQFDTKPQVRVGVMFDQPSGFNETQLVLEAGLNPGDMLPGKSLLNYSPLARLVYKVAEDANNRTDILPYHHLCLFYTFVPDNFTNIGRGSNYIYIHRGVTQAINAISNGKQNKLHTRLMVAYLPVISVPQESNSNICPDTISSSLRIFLGHKLEVIRTCTGKVKDTCLNIVTTRVNLFLATYAFMKKMNWKKFGIVTTCENLIELWYNDDNVILGQYTPSKLVEMFKSAKFDKNELNIFVYIGSITDFYRLLVEAYDNGFTTSERKYVWVVPFLSPRFYDMEYFQYYNFTDKERMKVLAALTGTILIQPFDGILSSTTMQLEGYISDALMVHTKAAEELLLKKAGDLQMNISNVVFSRNDYEDLSGILLNTTFDGDTGNIQFDSYCNRVSNKFSILNFVPCNETATTPYRMEKRGYIIITPDTFRVIFYTGGDINVESNISSLVFRDGKTNTPLDHIKRILIRKENVTVVSLVMSVVVYFIMVTVYIIWVYKNDKMAGVYDENWIYQDNDISYSLDQSGINIMLSWLSYNGQQTIGQINSKNAMVYIHKVRISTKQLTVKLRRNILTILDLKHKNICPFMGGILQDSTIAAIMYEYCSRGTLCSLLVNPHIVFNKSFRMSFTMDAAKGLAYLHSQKMIHGRLTSNNCVIDQYWNLKLTDYEPEEIHYTKTRKPMMPMVTLAVDMDKYSDIYNYGIILVEMCCRQTLLDYGTIDLCKLDYDEDVNDRFVMLIDMCLDNDKANRPSANSIKGTIKEFLSLYEYRSQTGAAVVEVYSQNLDGRIKEIEFALQEEKATHDEILANYIPKAAVEAMRGKVSMPLKQLDDMPIVCFGLCNIDVILSTYSSDQVAKVIDTVDKLLGGVAAFYGLKRIQCSGSIWTFIDDVYSFDDVNTNCVNIAKASLQVLQLFQKKSQQELSLRASLHCGSLICGVVNETIPFHAAIGNAISFAIQLMFESPVGEVLISEAFKTGLYYEHELKQFKNVPDKSGKLSTAYTFTTGVIKKILSLGENDARQPFEVVALHLQHDL